MKAEKYLILKITNHGVFFNESDFIAWKNTNFPDKKEFSFKENDDIFWYARLIKFSKESSTLWIDIVEYEIEFEYRLFRNQRAKFPFQNLYFKKLLWPQLEMVLSIYKRKSFIGIALDENIEEITPIELSKDLDLLSELETQPIIEKMRIRHEIDFHHPLMKTEFKLGYVEIIKKVKGIPDKITVHIRNPNIIPEFDHVKPFFSKALGTRKIHVKGYAEYTEEGKLLVNCQSAELDRINENLITAVKHLKLEESVFKPKLFVLDKSLFTPDEYFGSFDDDILGNVTQQNQKELLDEILDLSGIRNRKQLIYLSGRLQSEESSLRFTLSPNFGFLFYIKGQKMNHFIWELLNSHATYIWSILRDKFSLEEEFEMIEREVNFIRDNGRRVFLNSRKSSELIFNKVNHESRSGLKDGFPKWRIKVNEKLV